MGEVRLGVDVGGTFTDLVALRAGEIVTRKVPSTPEDQSEGVMRCIGGSGVSPDEVGSFAHGMTVATNALLERKGARTAMVTTEGFRDIIEIARQNRASLYDLARHKPPALVPRELRFTLAERVTVDKVLQKVDEDHLDEIVSQVKNAGVEAVAVCLLFSFLHPEHERLVGEALRKGLPDTHVSLSSDVLPEFREYERFSTAVADAYLAPKLTAYLVKLEDKVTAAGMPAPLVMQSSGGVMEAGDSAKLSVRCVLSGPAGGVVGAAYTARASGFSDVLTFDMGGTSTDVAPVIGGQVQTTTESVVSGVPIKAAMVDVHTVSAGGGSIAWVDDGGALRVGPQSAGADPGPAAYGKGGSDATVTDANLLLGYIEDGVTLGGEVTLQRAPAGKALGALGDKLGMEAHEAARGVIELANVEMVRALRVISVERGFDPREFALVAFGGAGPMHACALAEELGMHTVLVPKASGVLSALGLAISDLRRDYVSAYLSELSSADPSTFDHKFAAMETQARKDLDEPSLIRRTDLRYKGQSFELTIDAPELADLGDRFHHAHHQRYGYSMQGEPVEIVNLRLVASRSTEEPELVEPEGPEAPKAERVAANFDGEWAQVDVLARDHMGAGSVVDGPALVKLREATCVVRPLWSGEVDGSGTLVLRR